MPNSKATSRTDWKRVKKEIAEDAPIPYNSEDGPYDPNDAAAVQVYWNRGDILDAEGKVIRRGRGPQKSPTKERITIRFSHEVVDHFRAGGKGWQSRMDDVLREWIEHRR
jgi:uncharacterized protein (DUF4415 family)